MIRKILSFGLYAMVVFLLLLGLKTISMAEDRAHSWNDIVCPKADSLGGRTIEIFKQVINDQSIKDKHTELQERLQVLALEIQIAKCECILTSGSLNDSLQKVVAERLQYFTNLKIIEEQR